MKKTILILVIILNIVNVSFAQLKSNVSELTFKAKDEEKTITLDSSNTKAIITNITASSPNENYNISLNRMTITVTCLNQAENDISFTLEVEYKLGEEDKTLVVNLKTIKKDAEGVNANSNAAGGEEEKPKLVKSNNNNKSFNNKDTDKKKLKISVKNTGADTKITSVKISENYFKIVSGNLTNNAEIIKGKTLYVTIEYNPNNENETDAKLIVKYGGDIPLTISLKGEYIDSSSPAIITDTLNFGKLLMGEAKDTLVQLNKMIGYDNCISSAGLSIKMDKDSLKTNLLSKKPVEFKITYMPQDNVKPADEYLYFMSSNGDSLLIYKITAHIKSELIVDSTVIFGEIDKNDPSTQSKTLNLSNTGDDTLSLSFSFNYNYFSSIGTLTLKPRTKNKIKIKYDINNEIDTAINAILTITFNKDTEVITITGTVKPDRDIVLYASVAGAVLLLILLLFFFVICPRKKIKSAKNNIELGNYLNAYKNYTSLCMFLKKKKRLIKTLEYSSAIKFLTENEENSKSKTLKKIIKNLLKEPENKNYHDNRDSKKLEIKYENIADNKDVFLYNLIRRHPAINIEENHFEQKFLKLQYFELIFDNENLTDEYIKLYDKLSENKTGYLYGLHETILEIIKNKQDGLYDNLTNIKNKDLTKISFKEQSISNTILNEISGDDIIYSINRIEEIKEIEIFITNLSNLLSYSYKKDFGLEEKDNFNKYIEKARSNTKFLIGKENEIIPGKAEIDSRKKLPERYFIEICNQIENSSNKTDLYLLLSKYKALYAVITDKNDLSSNKTYKKINELKANIEFSKIKDYRHNLKEKTENIFEPGKDVGPIDIDNTTELNELKVEIEILKEQLEEKENTGKQDIEKLIELENERKRLKEQLKNKEEKSKQNTEKLNILENDKDLLKTQNKEIVLSNEELNRKLSLVISNLKLDRNKISASSVAKSIELDNYNKIIKSNIIDISNLNGEIEKIQNNTIIVNNKQIEIDKQKKDNLELSLKKAQLEQLVKDNVQHIESLNNNLEQKETEISGKLNLISILNERLKTAGTSNNQEKSLQAEIDNLKFEYSSLEKTKLSLEKSIELLKEKSEKKQDITIENKLIVEEKNEEIRQQKLEIEKHLSKINFYRNDILEPLNIKEDNYSVKVNNLLKFSNSSNNGLLDKAYIDKKLITASINSKYSSTVKKCTKYVNKNYKQFITEFLIYLEFLKKDLVLLYQEIKNDDFKRYIEKTIFGKSYNIDNLTEWLVNEAYSIEQKSNPEKFFFTEFIQNKFKDYLNDISALIAYSKIKDDGKTEMTEDFTNNPEAKTIIQKIEFDFEEVFKRTIEMQIITPKLLLEIYSTDKYEKGITSDISIIFPKFSNIINELEKMVIYDVTQAGLYSEKYNINIKPEVIFKA